VLVKLPSSPLTASATLFRRKRTPRRGGSTGYFILVVSFVSILLPTPHRLRDGGVILFLRSNDVFTSFLVNTGALRLHDLKWV